MMIRHPDHMIESSSFRRETEGESGATKLKSGALATSQVSRSGMGCQVLWHSLARVKRLPIPGETDRMDVGRRETQRVQK